MAIIRYTKEQNIQYAYLNVFPDQFKSAKQKQDDSWVKNTMDYFATKAYAEYIKNRDTFVKNYDLMKGILSREDFLIDEPEVILNQHTYCRATLDINISYEEASFIKETFSQQYNVREIALIPSKKEEHAQDWKVVDDIEVENVDQIVYNSLNAVDSEMINKKILVDIYNSL